MIASQLMAIPEQGLYLGDPPSAPPNNAQAVIINEETEAVGLQWINGDSSAYTQIGYSGSALVEPTSTYTTRPPGTTSWETGTTDLVGWWVRHFKNSQTTAWVYCLGE